VFHLFALASFTILFSNLLKNNDKNAFIYLAVSSSFQTQNKINAKYKNIFFYYKLTCSSSSCLPFVS
jgi:hypothetical protein